MSKAKKSVLYWLVLSPILLVILFPYAVMLSTALKPRSEIFVFDPTWWPSELIGGPTSSTCGMRSTSVERSPTA